MIIYLIYNIFVFIVYGIDKQKAIRHKRRISEETLITLSLFLGALGAISAMIFFRHKINSKHFKASIFITLILNALFVISIVYFYKIQ